MPKLPFAPSRLAVEQDAPGRDQLEEDIKIGDIRGQHRQAKF
jgi:hypothetical protein